SFQKGMWDMAAILRKLGGRQFRFQLVGTVLAEVKPSVSDVAAVAQFISKRPQHRLHEWYNANDLFIFPTLQDGFVAVLAQAQAAGLPVLTPTNCCGPDLI